MFNNCNSNTNGEYMFYRYLVETKNIKTIFDVGSRYDSDYLNFNGEVHYFEPVKDFLDKLKTKYNSNSKSYYNNFGLGNDNKEIYYYPNYQSFYDRTNSCKISDEKNKFKLNIRKGDDYISENNIDMIDLIKIDTEGFEFEVLKGLNNSLSKIKCIQFEYGGTYLDNGIKLIDVVDYLKSNNFYNFSYLTQSGPYQIIDFNDHYQYCNIVCFNKNLF